MAKMNFCCFVIVCVFVFIGYSDSLPIDNSVAISNSKNGTETNGLRLIEIAGEKEKWMTEAQLNEFLIFSEQNKGGGNEEEEEQERKWAKFADWTDIPVKVTGINPNLSAIPSVPVQQALVYTMIERINYLNLNYTIGTLETYLTRMYNTNTGEDSAVWLRDEMLRISQYKRSKNQLNISVALYEHNWQQPSVIAVMPGDGSTNEIIVMGAHLDSTSNTERAPGADDDGCGVATILEMFRVLVESDEFVPKRAIHFMFYAAEEVGLRGSADIASTYGGDNVYAVYQSEMCGWRGEEPDISLIDDAYTDGELVDFSELLVEEYCIHPPTRDSCGYACSDHASWNRVGARTICTAEAGPSGDLNPHYHRSTDLLIYIDTEYASDFVSFGVGFAAELSLAP